MRILCHRQTREYGIARSGNSLKTRRPTLASFMHRSSVMPKLATLEILLGQEIKDLYSAESQLLKALPTMAEAANNLALQDAFRKHEEETRGQAERLERIAAALDTPRGRSCKAMKGLIEEGEEIVGEDGDSAVKDLALIAAAQKVEHYEISGYGFARALSDALGITEIVPLLQAGWTQNHGEDGAGLFDKADERVCRWCSSSNVKRLVESN
jgi:ferritin-like metal-binding protein YciE